MIKIINKEINKEEKTASYKIQFNKDITLWFDMYLNDNNEITGDWNKYIFHTNDTQDMKEQAFQNDVINFQNAIEISTVEFEKDFNILTN